VSQLYAFDFVLDNGVTIVAASTNITDAKEFIRSKYPGQGISVATRIGRFVGVIDKTEPPVVIDNTKKAKS